MVYFKEAGGQQITRQIYLTNFNLTFGHKLLSVKKNVNIFALKFEYFFYKALHRVQHLEVINTV